MLLKTKRNLRILVLLWHPSPLGAVAGGFRIIEEVLKRTPEDFEVDVVDTKPSFLRSNDKVHVYEYKIPSAIGRTQTKAFAFGKILEFTISMLLIAFYALKLNRTKRYDIIHVPCSELFHVTLPAFLTKFVSDTKITLALLNVEIPGTGPRRTATEIYHEIRRAGYSPFIALSGVLLPTGHVSRWLHNKSEVVITLSNDLASKIKKWGVKREITVIPTGIDYKFIKAVPEQRKIYDGIFVGRYSLEKGVFDLVKAWKIVVEKRPNSKIILVGPSTKDAEKKLLKEIKEHNLEESIILYGPESDYEKVVKLIKQSRIVVFLSYIEGWGLVPIEGLACGLPVVAYDLPVYKESIKGHEAVFLVPIGDYKAAANKITELLTKSDMELIELSRKIDFVSKYDWDILAEETFSTLRRAATK